MTSVPFDLAVKGYDGFRSTYSTDAGNDKSDIFAKIIAAALLVAQPVPAESMRATPWFLRVPTASSSYQESKVQQETDTLTSIQSANLPLENLTLVRNADYDHIKQITELRNEILSFENLSQGWDGEDAEFISRNAIDAAIKFIESQPYEIEFDAYADPDGSVGLQGNMAGGRILLSFAEDGKAAYSIRNNNEVDRGHGATQDKINKLLAVILQPLG